MPSFQTGCVTTWTAWNFKEVHAYQRRTCHPSYFLSPLKPSCATKIRNIIMFLGTFHCGEVSLWRHLREKHCTHRGLMGIILKMTHFSILRRCWFVFLRSCHRSGTLRDSSYGPCDREISDYRFDCAHRSIPPEEKPTPCINGKLLSTTRCCQMSLFDSTPPHWAATQMCIFQMSLMLPSLHITSWVCAACVEATNPKPSHHVSPSWVRGGNMTEKKMKKIHTNSSQIW